MKLLFCKDCWDIFKLDTELRQCKCGKVKGKYLSDNLTAEISETAISLAIGNGSLARAINDMEFFRQFTEDKAKREEYYLSKQGLIDFAWVRPNSGPGNPHCKVNKEL